MDIQQLTRPFAPHEIETRQGKKNMQYQYVSSKNAVNRLHEVLSPNGWNLVVKETLHIGNEIAVLVSLQIGDVMKEAYGSATLDGKTLGDALKTSQALGLVKCCSLLGMPVTFNSKPQNNNFQQQQNYNQAPAPTQQSNPNPNGCDDCGNHISQQEINFTLSNPQYYSGRKICRKCQPSYKKRA